ncbi:hypothetical protein AVEN_73699-1 [Araneus ventricosus]|uniref:Uncharacterized protein n=1 Tax=Araneus ventricosus TaxID=182803 RepID=A0A4Y2HQP5_ARAVE|nr:hypothetical protein AVEN_73699-1 [Araneus ventricosus]
MSLALVECPLYVRERLAAQLFVDAIRDEDPQLSMRLMDLKDMKLALANCLKYEAAKIASKISSHARSIKIEDNTGKENDNNESLLRAFEKLVDRLAA